MPRGVPAPRASRSSDTRIASTSRAGCETANRHYGRPHAVLLAVEGAFRWDIDYARVSKIYGSDPDGAAVRSGEVPRHEVRPVSGDPNARHISRPVMWSVSSSRCASRCASRLTNAFRKRASTTRRPWRSTWCSATGVRTSRRTRSGTSSPPTSSAIPARRHRQRTAAPRTRCARGTVAGCLRQSPRRRRHTARRGGTRETRSRDSVLRDPRMRSGLRRAARRHAGRPPECGAFALCLPGPVRLPTRTDETSRRSGGVQAPWRAP